MMGVCQKCGLQAETKEVTVLRSIGMLIAVNYRTVRGNWCRPCIDSELGPASLVTATLGWWSIIGLFLTPIFLALNFATFLRTRGMALPMGAGSALPSGGAAGAFPGGPRMPDAGAAPPEASSGSPIALGIGGAVIAAIGVLLSAFFAYTWAFGTNPNDARFSPICLGLSFLVCVMPGVAAAGFAGYRALAKR